MDHVQVLETTLFPDELLGGEKKKVHTAPFPRRLLCDDRRVRYFVPSLCRSPCPASLRAPSADSELWPGGGSIPEARLCQAAGRGIHCTCTI